MGKGCRQGKEKGECMKEWQAVCLSIALFLRRFRPHIQPRGFADTARLVAACFRLFEQKFYNGCAVFERTAGGKVVFLAVGGNAYRYRRIGSKKRGNK